MKAITIEQLAEHLNGNLWVKGDLKRIYLDEGHNTKKMSTKTFVFQDDNGDFKVSCKVDCPSQPWQWCKSQEDDVKESVYSQIDYIIEKLTSDSVFVLYSDGSFVDYFNNKFDAGDPLYSEDAYYSLERAQAKIDEYELKAEIKVFNKSDWDELCSRFVPKEEVSSAPVVSETPTTPAVELKNPQTITYGVGNRVSHTRFMAGIVLAENDEQIEIEFDNAEHGKRKLIKKFVKLELVG